MYVIRKLKATTYIDIGPVMRPRGGIQMYWSARGEASIHLNSNHEGALPGRYVCTL